MELLAGSDLVLAVPGGWGSHRRWEIAAGAAAGSVGTRSVRPSFLVLSVIIRDSNGNFLFAWTTNDFAFDPAVVEAKAACLALANTRTLGLHNIILEGDAAEVLEQISNWDSIPSWSINPLVCDARSSLRNFSFWSVNCISQLANKAAHALTQWAAFCNRYGIIPISDLPPSVLSAEVKNGIDSAPFSVSLI
ncbi:hypothetical protein L1049_001695 [Liquidambar formosana]|uniref:RNase H type-1 domain-containing protein n=1 Tax=Liquidambar formosana TaxID=63359 RepID=A0AAP0R2H1_LIQFO